MRVHLTLAVGPLIGPLGPIFYIQSYKNVKVHLMLTVSPLCPTKECVRVHIVLVVRPFMSNQRSGSASYVGSKTLYVQSYEGVGVHLILAARPFMSNQRSGGGASYAAS